MSEVPVPVPVQIAQSGLATAAQVAAIVAAATAVAALTWVIVNKILGDDNATREAWTKNYVDQYTQANPDYNIVVVHTEHSVAGIYLHMHVEVPVTVGTVGFEIYVSPKGRPFTFTLTGDGGFINWAFEGEFNQDFGTITAIEHGSYLWAAFTGTEQGQQPVLLCSSADGANWSDSIFVPSPAGSNFAPSLAVFNNNLYVALLSAFIDTDPPTPPNQLLLCPPWPDGTGTIFFDQFAQDAPSLAVFNNLLYVAFVGTDPGRPLLVCSSADGVNWTNYTDFNQHSSSAPSLAVFNNSLYVAFVGTNPGSPLLVCSSPDGVNWTNYTDFNQHSSSAPSLAVFNNSLYVAFVGTDPGSPLLVCSSPDGVNWTNYTDFNQHSSFAPSLAVFNNSLYVGFVGTDPSHPLVVCSSADGANWTNYTSTNQSSQTAPSLGVWF